MKYAFADNVIRRMEQIGVDVSDLPDEAWMKFLHDGWQLQVRWVNTTVDTYQYTEKQIRLVSRSGENYWHKKP